MRIVVGGIKGGVGKTTVATHLAVMRQSEGRTVVLLDADEQRSASEFAEQRAALGNGVLPCRKASGATDTIEAVIDLAERYDDVIIDVGGRDTQAQRAALLRADLVILPMPPGNYDAWTLQQAETLIREVRQANPDLDAASFISRGYIRGRDNQEAAEMLRASMILRYIDAPLLERRVYVRSAGDGLAVTEYDAPADAKARAEITSLYTAVFSGQAAAAA